MRKTSNTKLLKYILGLLLICITHASYGQLNLKVGYSFGHTNLEQTKLVFDQFNLDNPQAEKKLSPVKNFHGVDLGMRYRFKHFGIDAGLSSMSGSSEALNVFQSNGALGKDEWRISIINYSIGLENYFGSYGYGASFGFQKLKYKTEFESGQGKKTVFNETTTFSKFYLILEVPSNKIAFSIRPFISTTWQPYDIKEVALITDSQSTIPDSDLMQDVVVYGISFLFLNGPQKR